MSRPSSYKPEYAEQATKLCDLGATDDEIAEFFEVSTRTIHRWKVDFPEFCHALKAGKEVADARIERSLFQRASGYNYAEQRAFKLRNADGAETVEVVDIEVHQPADTTAMIFWLKNRRPDQWRDARDVNVRRYDQMSDDELDRAIAERLAELGQGEEGGLPKPH